MEVLFQNHSSLIIRAGDRYLLTDPWFDQPAFGSWLPSLPSYLHPAYLAALGPKLTILVSHGHDDHFDDRLFTLFDRNTKVITADFKSPSVKNRLKRLGFDNVGTVGIEERTIEGLTYSSYIVSDLSHDDAAYLIRNDQGAVLHTNDNWHIFSSRHHALIEQRVRDYDRASILLFSQTNSASGYPLNYRDFTDEEKRSLLRKKVAKMVEGGLRNAESLSLPRMFSYAGFAAPYVKGRDYEHRGLFPTAAFLKQLLHEEGVRSPVDIAGLYPGDHVSLPSGAIVRAFINGYPDERIKSAANDFYHRYGKVAECISYQEVDFSVASLAEWLAEFIDMFNDFVVARVAGPDAHHASILGKTFKLQVDLPNGDAITKVIEFGIGQVDDHDDANKTCYVSAAAMISVLKGASLFEDLYTGYNAEWSRHPRDVYNRDIVMMIVTFSYVYKNRHAAQLRDRHGL